MIPVVLSGGSGTRLWPASRTKLPKQFCSIFKQSLHSMTLERLKKVGDPIVITSHALRDLTIKNLRDLNVEVTNLILEPQSKNTAPATALLTYYLLLKGLGDSVVGIFPADHVIENEEVFMAAVRMAEDQAFKGKVVTIGINPDRPETGYGYIQTSNEVLSSQGQLKSHFVLKFHEKPSLEQASLFLNEGGFYWNAGIFVFKVNVMVEHFKKLQPQLWNEITALRSDLSNIESIYRNVDNISIDYAIMEKLAPSDLACIPCDIGWNDVGSWDSIAQILGSADKKIEIRAKNNFVQSAADKTYAFIEVDDLIVVDTSDALLLSRKGATQGVKDVVNVLRMQNSRVLDEHPFEERPWGRFEVLKDTDVFKSKVIQVNPHQQISYQSHSKREEHWLITKGQGEVILNDEEIPVKPGSYVKIPLGAKHRIRNSGESIIEFVEVQMGTYFGEDDIVRYQDDYERS